MTTATTPVTSSGTSTDRSAEPRWSVGMLGAAGLALAFGLATWWAAVSSGTYVRLVSVLVAGLCAGLVVLLAADHVAAVVVVLLLARASLDAVVFEGGRTVGVGLSEVAGGMSVVVCLVFLAGEVLARRWDASRAAVAALAFLAAVLASIPASTAMSVSVTVGARVAAYVLLFVVLDSVVARRREAAWWVVAAILASAAVPLLVGTWQLATGSGLLERGGFASVVGTFVHPNTFGRYLGLVTILGVAVFPVVPSAWKAALAACTPLLALNLVQTYARGAWISILIGLVLVVGLRRRRLVPAVAASVVLVLGSMAVPSVGERFSDLATADAASSGETANSLEWRIMHWQRVAPLSVRNPITGLGAGASDDVNRGGKAPHNDYLRAVVELGWVGGATYFVLLLLLLQRARRGLREAGDESERAVAIGFAGVLATVVVVSLTENLMYQVVFMTYFLALAAAARGPSDRA